MQDIFTYISYQSYLKDYYENRKAKDSFFSYRFLGKKLGIDAGFLIKIFQGKVHLSLKAIPGVVRFIGMGKKEGEYFELLVKYGRAKSAKEIKELFDQLCAHKTAGFCQLQVNQYAFFQKWYHSAIWTLLGAMRFKGDFGKLARKLDPKITEKQARESIALLIEMNLVRKQADGSYLTADKFITTGEKWKAAAVREFQLETLRLAQAALENQPMEIRDISTVTISVSSKDFEEIRERAKAFRRSLMELKTENNTVDSLYQVNIQIFPLTKLSGEGI